MARGDHSYVRAYPAFFTGDTGRRLRAAGPEAVLVATYIMMGPQTHPTGMFQLPVVLLSHHLPLTPEGASKGLRRASEAGFCHYDEESEWVWVPEAARHQIGDTLSAGDNRIKWLVSAIRERAKCPWVRDFLEKYAAAYHLPKRLVEALPEKPLRRGFEAPSKPPAPSPTPSPVRVDVVRASGTCELVRAEGHARTHAPGSDPGQRLEGPDPPLLNEEARATLAATLDAHGAEEVGEPAGESNGHGPPGYSKAFESWWEAYPRKVGKGTAWSAWKGLGSKRPAPEVLIVHTERLARSRQWQEAGGKYIPHPSTWLRRHGWEDQLEDYPDPERPRKPTTLPRGEGEAIRKQILEEDRGL